MMSADDCKQQLTELPYYHPHVNNSEQALKVLNGCGHGTFILRNCSGKHEGFCAVSVVVGANEDWALRHFDIRLRDGSLYFERKKPFRTLPELVAYYSVNDVPNSRGLTGVRLLQPRQMKSRSPAPLPQPPVAAVGHLEEVQAMAVRNVEYSYASHEDRTDGLIFNLGLQHQQQMKLPAARRSTSNGGSVNEKCVCGIRLVDAALPGGWTVHQNVKERAVFFKDLAGTSHWQLPADIDQRLSDQQRGFIKFLTEKMTLTESCGDEL